MRDVTDHQHTQGARNNDPINALFMSAAALTVATIATVATTSPRADTPRTVHTIGGATLQSAWAGTWVEGPGNYKAARGRVNALGHFSAKVTCMSVSGNDGVVTAAITLSVDRDYPVGEFIVAEAVDNGGSGDLWRISFQNNGGLRRVGPACYAPIFAPVAIRAGHVDVHLPLDLVPVRRPASRSREQT